MGTRPAEDLDDLQQFLSERNEALRTLNLAWARAQVTEASIARFGHPPTDEVLLLSLHKGRYCCTHIEPELRHESGRWLRERGYSQANGEPLLPEGVLPE